MKTCRKCGVAKPVAEFNRNRSRRDGLDHRCKPCHREQSKAWQRGPGKDAHQRAVKAWLQRNPERRLAADQRTRSKNPTHWRARRAVREALLRGTLVRPSHCTECGSAGPIQGHHWRGYDPAEWLNVKWLCTRCHRVAHRPVVVG